MYSISRLIRIQRKDIKFYFFLKTQSLNNQFINNFKSNAECVHKNESFTVSVILFYVAKSNS